MHGVAAKRRTAHFGHTYEFGTFKLTPAPPIPDFLLSLRRRVAGHIYLRPEELVEALVSEYPPGAQIGWHRDAPQFGIIIGISLLSACTMKLRAWPPQKGAARTRPLDHLLARRSAYVLDNKVRSQWQHHIPPAKELRYSITFRTLAFSGAAGSHPNQPTA
jgi:alkylated DNA repair protein (DNA oxidative demethylase)